MIQAYLHEEQVIYLNPSHIVYYFMDDGVLKLVLTNRVVAYVKQTLPELEAQLSNRELKPVN